MSDTALMLDAILMGICAGVVAWALLAPLGVIPQIVGTFLVFRIAAVGFGQWQS